MHFGKDFKKRHWVSSNTEFILDGYGSSANTFAIQAFYAAQRERRWNVSHHTHSAAQVLRGIKLGLPVLILIRDPVDAIPSAVARFHCFCCKPEDCLKHEIMTYLDFYRPLLPYIGNFVVGEFQDVISDYGKVIHAVNQKFGTSFGIFEHTEENVKKCLEHPRNKAAKPSLAREIDKEKLRAVLVQDLYPLIHEAQWLYRAIVTAEYL
jgi:hypothetical protein